MNKKGLSLEYVIKAILFLAVLMFMMWFLFGFGIEGKKLSKCEMAGGVCLPVCAPDMTQLDYSCERKTDKLPDEIPPETDDLDCSRVACVCCFDPERVTGSGTPYSSSTAYTGVDLYGPEDLTELKTKAEVQVFINRLVDHVWEEAAKHSGESVTDVKKANDSSFALRPKFQYDGYVAKDQKRLNELVLYQKGLAS